MPGFIDNIELIYNFRMPETASKPSQIFPFSLDVSSRLCALSIVSGGKIKSSNLLLSSSSRKPLLEAPPIGSGTELKIVGIANVQADNAPATNIVKRQRWDAKLLR